MGNSKLRLERTVCKLENILTNLHRKEQVTVRLSFKTLETEIIGSQGHFLLPLPTKRGFVSLQPAISL